MPMQIVTCVTQEEFVRTAVALIATTISEATTERAEAIVGLSGGSTPKPIYTMLATDQHIPWKKVKFFLTDERYVPAVHPDSNQGMVRSTLLTRDAAEASLIAPRTELLLEKCIADYDEKIHSLGHPDLVILGMGDDGHIASLFPSVPPQAFGPASVIHTQTDRFAVKDRISVTFPPLLHAKKRIFLITGKKKTELLRMMQSANEDVSLYPAQYLFDAATVWVVGP